MDGWVGGWVGRSSRQSGDNNGDKKQAASSTNIVANLHGEHVGQLIDALLEFVDVSLLRLDRALKHIPVRCIMV